MAGDFLWFLNSSELTLCHFPESLFFHEAMSWRAFIGAVSSGLVDRISFKISSSSGKRDRPFEAGLEAVFSSEPTAVLPEGLAA